MKLRTKTLYLLAALLVSVPLFATPKQSTIEILNKNGTNLVPLRIISEAVGATPDYNKETKVILITRGDLEIKLTIGATKAYVNGVPKTLSVAPCLEKGTTYVPFRFIGEAFGAAVDYKDQTLSVTLDGTSHTWTTQQKKPTTPTSSATPFKASTQTIAGKKVNLLTINLNDPKVQIKVQTAKNKVTEVQNLKDMAPQATALLNGTYFAAYNGDTPLPDGTLMVNGNVLHLTDTGTTIGFTADNRVVMDQLKLRLQGYINDEPAWITYRVNKSTADSSAFIIYTPEFGLDVPIPSGWAGVVCVNGQVSHTTTTSRKVPENGFIIVTMAQRATKFTPGDNVRYEPMYEREQTFTHTTASDWEDVTMMLSAGPSLILNGKVTGDPKDESFNDPKILTNSATRAFIGVRASNELVMGTTSGTINDMKKIAKELGLVNAMCVDGGASAGLYYNGTALHTPSRQINNCIAFYYAK